ncbi:glycosyltransferase family 2 protein [Microvirga arabica]|uniref:Glycosyltransferase family 2 protein n=1 Tax=Microvirga arabica TaxID=1128671 RepID=A0ABV6YB38_9HYPH
MSSIPRVSVLMPVRNGLPFLKEAVDSILDQSIKDVELVVVDDGSEDGSTSYLMARSLEDARVVLLRNAKSYGISAALNLGAEYCRAPWIARMDCDDRALPQRLERQLAFLDVNPDVQALGSLAYLINSQGHRIGLAPHDMTTRNAYKKYMESNRTIGLVHPSVIIRRVSLREVGGYRSDFEPAEDIDLWNRLSEQGPVLVLPEFLLEYRVHPTSVVSTRLELALLKEEWVEACMLARRNGSPEPIWGEFRNRCENASLQQRLNRQRRILAERLLSLARRDLAAGARSQGRAKQVVAAALRPIDAAPKILRQMRLALRQES